MKKIKINQDEQKLDNSNPILFIILIVILFSLKYNEKYCQNLKLVECIFLSK